MADLTVQRISRDGLNPAYVAASATGDTFTNNDRTFLHVKNADAAPHTVTCVSQTPTPNFPEFGVVSITNVSVAVPASGERMIAFPIRPFSPAGKVNVTYDAVVAVTVGVFELPRP